MDHLADGTVDRNRIAARQNGAEAEAAVSIGDEARPRRRPLRLIGRLLRVIKAVIVGVPDVDRHAGERLAAEVGDPALHEHPLALQLGRNVRAVRHHLVFPDIEGAEHGGLGGAFALPVVDRIDQHGNAEHVGEQDELLADRGAFLPGTGQKIDRKFPFLEGQIGPAHIIVQ